MQPSHNPGVAAVLSALLPGLGHIYIGRLGIGMTLIASLSILWAFVYYLMHRIDVQLFGVNENGKIFLGSVLIGTIVAWLFAIVHSFVVARRSAMAPVVVAGSRDIGEETWAALAAQPTKAALEEFIARFPDHPRVLMAKMALDRLAVPATGADGRSIAPGRSVVEQAAESAVGVRYESPLSVRGETRRSAVGIIAAVVAAVVVLAGAGVGVWQFTEVQRRDAAAAEARRADSERQATEQAERQRVEQETERRMAEERRQREAAERQRAQQEEEFKTARVGAWKNQRARPRVFTKLFINYRAGHFVVSVAEACATPSGDCFLGEQPAALTPSGSLKVEWRRADGEVYKQDITVLPDGRLQLSTVSIPSCTQECANTAWDDEFVRWQP